MRMSDALIRAGRDIVFGICEWGTNKPYEWASDLGHMWRTTEDITHTKEACEWNNIMANYEESVELFNYSTVNAYNDPDMLCTGLNGISF